MFWGRTGLSRLPKLLDGGREFASEHLDAALGDEECVLKLGAVVVVCMFCVCVYVVA